MKRLAGYHWLTTNSGSTAPILLELLNGVVDGRKDHLRSRIVLRDRFGQRAATRSAIPLIDYMPQPDVIRGSDPVTAGADTK